MIVFGTPWLLAALLPLVALWIFVFPDRRRMIVRCVAVALLIVALAQPSLPRRGTENTVLLLVDRSASVELTEDAGETDSILHALLRAHPEWRFGAIAFADGAISVAPLGALTLPVEAPELAGAATDLTAAIDLALATLADEPAPQIVLVSDGRFSDTHDAALDALQLSGIPVSVLPSGSVLEDDVALASITAPTEISIDRPFEIDIRATSSGAGEATLAIYRNDDLIAAEAVAVTVGENRWRFTDVLQNPGATAYRVIIKYPGDPLVENDGMETVVNTTDRATTLLIDRAGTSAISELLEAIGLSYSVAEEIPELEFLSQQRQVILTGMPLADLTSPEISRLETFVRDLGGGLLVVEGEAEARGLRGGGIEEILPVSFTLPESGQEASQAILFLLDRSASMQARITGGTRKIDILKEATAASLRAFNPENLVGIIAFDREFEWLLPLQTLDGGDAAYDALGPLEAVGGTDLYYPLIAALDELDATEARSKHILLISDGKTVDEVRDYPRLLSRIRNAEGLAVTAIAVGQSPNLQLLGAITQAGGGSLYRAEDFANLPQVTLEATQRLTSSRFITEPTAVTGRLLSAAPELADPPPVGGHLATHPKTSAVTDLWAGEDPLVTSWRIGLGTVTALNTDLEGRWTSGWLEWPQVSALFEGILSLSEPMSMSTAGLTPVIDVSGQTVSVMIDARQDDRSFANFLQIESLLLPGNVSVPVDQVGPGLYTVALPSLGEGGYALQVNDRTRDRSLIASFTLPYAEEYRATGIRIETLVAIAERTGGIVLDGTTALPTPQAATEDQTVSLVWALILASLGVFLLDLLVRKLPRRRSSAT